MLLARVVCSSRHGFPLLTVFHLFLKVSVSSLAMFDELPLSPLPVKTGKGPWEEKEEEEEEGEDVPNGVVIDPLLVGDNGLENGHDS